MHPVADFSSILEVSIGLHIAYSLLESVYNRYLGEAKQYLEDLKKMYERVSDSNKSKAGNALEEFNYCVFFWHEGMFSMVISFRVISGIVALLSIVLLVLTSLFPYFSIPTWLAVLLVILLLLPMPSFVIFSEIWSRYLFGHLFDEAQKAFRTIDDQLWKDRGVRSPSTRENGGGILGREQKDNHPRRYKVTHKLFVLAATVLVVVCVWEKMRNRTSVIAR